MNQKIIDNKHGFAIFPSVKIMNFVTDNDGTKTLKWIKHLIFGDWIGLNLGPDGQPVFEVHNNIQYVSVRGRNCSGLIEPHEIQPNRILELNFVDVGQGDGCHVVTPENKHYIIDAGASDNMFRYLKWRFNLNKAGNFPPPMDVVISHSDEDHYAGFTKIFEHTKEGRKTFNIKNVYHNGMVEKSGTHPSTLGTLVTSQNKSYITDLCQSEADYQARVTSQPLKHGQYIKMLQKTTADKIGIWAGLPGLDTDSTKMEILGPVTQDVLGKPGLPVFGSNKGKTKNGHSVILKLTVGKVKMLLGGDLNEPAEDHLMKHYTGADLPLLRKGLKSADPVKRLNAGNAIRAAVLQARTVFQTDIAKSCHHGSSDFTSEFMDALNPIATVISSGDEEPHCHPRPDTLGTIGKYSRGLRSLIFSTELARSTPEFLKKTQNSNTSAPITKERLVTVYGMINVRTDGEKIIIAQKLEAPADRGAWDIHEITWNSALNEFEYLF
ncbi:ComEC/Rec2 family competence protein [Flavobacterium sp. W22_SRS_FK3]|uniref:ComEC/Rec2 family competence protein n=1 Tax=Flavobacterium sp. W22_SRS_FK3 TaxID=3240275 RepID=UPI003F8F06BA